MGKGEAGKRIAYFDCFSGASGDMLLGALLDAGLSLETLREDLSLLGLAGVDLALTRQVRHGIAGSRFEVIDRSSGAALDGQDRPARNLYAVRGILEASSLPPEVIEPSLRVFQRLAEAEARVHGTTVDEVHFHELGAVDSLIDIVGFQCAIRRLGIEALYASRLPLGGGTIRTAHGLLPVPAPATLALLAEAGTPTVPFQADGELLTPTGAAILSTLARFVQPPMVIRQVGYGFGAKEFPWPNVLRVWIGEALDLRADPAGDLYSSQDHGHVLVEPHEHERDEDHTHGH